MNESLGHEIWPLIAKTGGALFVIVAVLLIFLFVAKKYMAAPGVAGSIKMAGSIHLSPRERLVLVEVLGKKVLLGITPGKIEKIEVFEPNQEIMEKNASQTGSTVLQNNESDASPA